MTAPSPDHGRLRPARPAATWVDMLGGFVVAAGAALVLVRFLGEDPIARNVESLVASVALGAVIATPGVLCLIANRTGRPALLLSSGIVLALLATISPATLPLLAPAVALLLRWARCGPGPSRLRALAASIVVIVGVLGAAALLILRTTTRTFSSADHTYQTTGWVPLSTSALVFAALVASIAAACALLPGRAGRAAAGRQQQ